MTAEIQRQQRQLLSRGYCDDALPLQIAADLLASAGCQYGDIVLFPAGADGPQRMEHPLPCRIHPKQKWQLVAPRS